MTELDWSRAVTAFADSGTRALTVLASDAVREAWPDDSILPEMTVGDVAGHLVAVLIMFDRRYDLAVPAGAVAVDPGGAGYASVRLDRASDLDRPAFRIPRASPHAPPIAAPNQPNAAPIAAPVMVDANRVR